MAIAPIQVPSLPQPETVATTAKPQPGFDAMLDGGVTRLDETLKSADAGLQAYAAGTDIPVHEVMIGMEKARLTMEFAVEVRNRVVEAYQDFMRMQL